MAKRNQSVQGTVNASATEAVNVPEKGSFIAEKMASAKGAAGHVSGTVIGGVKAVCRNLSPATYGAMTGLIGGTAIGIGSDLIGRTGVVVAENALNSIEFKKGVLGKRHSMNLGEFRGAYGCVIPAEDLTGKVGNLRKVKVTGPMTVKRSAAANRVVDTAATAGGALSGVAIAKKNYRSCRPQQPTCTSQEFFDAFNAYAESCNVYEEPVEGGVQ